MAKLTPGSRKWTERAAFAALVAQRTLELVGLIEIGPCTVCCPEGSHARVPRLRNDAVHEWRGACMGCLLFGPLPQDVVDAIDGAPVKPDR